MPKLTSNLYDTKTKTLLKKGDEAPKDYKGVNVEKAKKKAKKDEE